MKELKPHRPKMNRVKFWFWISLASLQMTAFQNCGAPRAFQYLESQSASQSVTADFADIQSKILGPKCSACHDFSTYQKIMSTGYVVVGQPLSSALYLAVDTGRMPLGQAALSDVELESLYTWILNAGNLTTPTPTPTPTPNPTNTIGTFAWFNTTIIQVRCVVCHSAGGASGGFDMSTYAKVKTRVIPGNALDSKLYQELASGNMPKGSSPLSAAELNGVKAWIDNGALNN